jgi:hypothetical protein
MSRTMSLACCVLLWFQSAAPGTPTQDPQDQKGVATAEKTLVAACAQPCLEDGTPVQIAFAQEVSSGTAHSGDQIQFEVVDEVRVGGVVVIPKGALAWGTVTMAQARRRMARGGKIDIQINAVRLADGEKASLRATKQGNGGGHVGAMTVGIVAAGLLFFPVAPLFLLMKGKDITFPKGTQVPVFVDGNFRLDLAKFEANAPGPAQTDPNPPPAATAAASDAEVTLHSDPDGAEVSVDGAFVGDTPSVVHLAPGDHKIQMTKTGYLPWERTVKAVPGAVTVNAQLDAEPSAVAPKP